MTRFAAASPGLTRRAGHGLVQRPRVGPALRGALPSRGEFAASSVAAAATYLAYGAFSAGWTNPALIGAAVILMVSIPMLARASNWAEAKALGASGKQLPGLGARFVVQAIANLVLIGLLVAGGIIPGSVIAALGGFLAATALCTAVSQGFQYVALAAARGGLGTDSLNVTLTLAASLLINAAALSGTVFLDTVYLGTGIALGAWILAYGLYADLRGRSRPLS